MSHFHQSLGDRRQRIKEELESGFSRLNEGTNDCWIRFQESESFVDLYDDRFHHLCTLEAMNYNLSPEEANKYDSRFECLDVLDLYAGAQEHYGVGGLNRSETRR